MAMHQLLLLFLLFFDVSAKKARPSLNLTIGIDDYEPVFCENLFKATFDFKDIGDVNMKIIPVHFSSGDTILTYNYSYIESLKLSVILGRYEFDVALVSKNLGIPFLMEVEQQFAFPRNTFQLLSLNTILIQAFVDLKNFIPSITYLCVVAEASKHQIVEEVLKRVPNIEVEVVYYTVNLTENELSRKFESLSSSQPGSNSLYLYVPLETALSFVSQILQVASDRGFMSNKQIWYFMTTQMPHDLIYPFQFTYSRFVIPGLPVSGFPSKKLYSEAVCVDAVNFIVKAFIDSPSEDPISKIILGDYTGRTGQMSFQPNGRPKTAKLLFYTPSLTEPRMEYAGYWDIKDNVSKVENIIPRLVLKNEKLRIGVVKRTPFVYDWNYKTGFTFDIFEEIAALLNLDTEFVLLNTTSAGGIDEMTGNWTGLLEQLDQKKIDITGNLFPIINSWKKFFDYTPSIVKNEMFMVVAKEEDHINWLAPIQHVQFDVWICMVLALIFHSLLLFIISQIMPPKKAPRMSIGDASLVVFNLFTLGKMEIDRHTFSARVVSVFIWFYSLFIFASLASVFPNQVHNKYHNHLFPSIGAMTQNSTASGRFDKYRWILEENSSTLSAIREFNESWAALFDDYLRPTSINDTSIDLKLIPLAKVSSELRKRESNIFITDETTSVYLTRTNCVLENGDVSLFPFTSAFLHRKNWHLKSEFHRALSVLETQQRTRVLWLKWMTYFQCPKIATLDMYGILPYFGMLGIGVGLAIFVALCEILTKVTKKAWARRSYTKFVFGNDFDCVVKDTTTTGIWVEFHGRPVPYFIPNSHLHSHPIKKFNAKSLNITTGNILTMRYFGKDPVTKKKNFFHDRTPQMTSQL